MAAGFSFAGWFATCFLSLVLWAVILPSVKDNINDHTTEVCQGE